ncbi:MAG: SpoIID/LytB domain-containing protein [Candidatus Limnocylindrales bacterium]
MHRRLAAWVCALTLAATAVVLPSAAPTVEAAAACTNWNSTLTPPSTIRVLRTHGPAAGKVQVVPFRAYVENVMAWEWPETYPAQALRAGAVAVKQFGWYYARTWRGGKTASGACYDVKDTSIDQIYRPETRSAGPKQRKAVAVTWNLHVRRTRNGKPGKFILTGYVPGTIASCGAEKNGYRLYQRGVKACAKAGLTYEQIARIYYGPTLQLTDPGRHNIVGTLNGRGDIAAAVPTAEGIDVHVRASTGVGFNAPATPDAHPTNDGATLGRVSADLDGDGADELVSLISDGPTSQHIEVRRATGFEYGEVSEGLAWDSDAAGVAFVSERDGKPGIQLLAGDFDADYDDDLALVVSGDDPGTGTVQLLRSSKTFFTTITQTYTGAFEPQASRAFAGDVTGDNRADIVLQTTSGGGLAFRVMATTTAAGYELADPVTWYTGTDLAEPATKAILLDYTRDSRDDLVLAIDASPGTVYRGLRSTGKAFSATTIFSASMAFDRVKLATSDVNHDGRGDVVVYAKPPNDAAGTRLYVYRSTGTALAAAEMWLEDASLDWQTVEPY